MTEDPKNIFERYNSKVISPLFGNEVGYSINDYFENGGENCILVVKVIYTKHNAEIGNMFIELPVSNELFKGKRKYELRYNFYSKKVDLIEGRNCFDCGRPVDGIQVLCERCIRPYDPDQCVKCVNCGEYPKYEYCSEGYPIPRQGDKCKGFDEIHTGDE